MKIKKMLGIVAFFIVINNFNTNFNTNFNNYKIVNNYYIINN